MIRRFTALLLTMISGITYAQETIFTDRPNTTDAVKLLTPGTFQVEAGFLFEKDDMNGVKNNSYYAPNLILKYGISKSIEMRVLTDYLTQRVQVDTAETETSGFTPITISPKLKITDQHVALPAMSLLTNITLAKPADEAYENDLINYGFRLLLEHVFNDRYSWSHGFGADWDDTRETVWAYSSSFNIVLNNNLGAFAEIYGNFAIDYLSTHVFDTGLTYLIRDNLQVDASVGLPLNENAPDLILGFGLAWRTSLTNSL